MRVLVAAMTLLALLLPAAGATADVPGPHQQFAITREATKGLPDHTLFRPTNLDAPAFKLPIVVWGNGGCRNSNEEFRYFLWRFAAYGYLVVANGAPENPYDSKELSGLADPKPEKLIAGIDWALKQNADPASPLHDRLDPTRIVVMGQSCGGGEAIDASVDPRVDATIAWNEGLATQAGSLHAPILYVSGGILPWQDFTAGYVRADYERTPAPAVLADNPNVGHTGLWDDPSDGTPPPGPWQNEPLAIAPQWINFILYGSDAGRQFFLGDECGLCKRGDWTVESKGWEDFRVAPSEAPPRMQAPRREASATQAPSTAAPAPAAPRRCAATRRVRVRAPRSAARAVVFVNGRRRLVLRGRRLRRGALVTVRTNRRNVVRIVGRTRAGRPVSRVIRVSRCT